VRKKKVVSWEAFVVAWQESNSVREVAKRLKIRWTDRTAASLSTRASYGRRKGVDMRRMTTRPAPTTPNDWAALAGLAKKTLAARKRSS